MENTTQINEDSEKTPVVDLPQLLQEVSYIGELLQDNSSINPLIEHSKDIKDANRYINIAGAYDSELINDLLNATVLGSFIAPFVNDIEIHATKEGEEPYALLNGEKKAIEKAIFQLPDNTDIKVYADNPWLRAGKFILRLKSSLSVDMNQPDDIFSFFGKTDLQIFIINALAALTKNEVELIRACDERNISYLIDISNLQMVNDEERESVVEYIEDYVIRFFAPESLIKSNSTEGFRAYPIFYEQIQKRMEVLNIDRARLEFFLSRVIQFLIQKRNLVISLQKEKNERILDIKQQENKDKLMVNIQNDQWLAIGNSLVEKRQSIETQLREHLGKNRKTVTDSLLFEIGRSVDPKTTWERDLPYFINRELQQSADRLNGTLKKEISETLVWLQNEVISKFQIKIPVPQAEMGKTGTDDVYKPKELPLMNTHKWRINAKFGNAITLLGVGTIFISAPIGGLVVASSIIYQAIVDKHISSVASKDKDKVRVELLKVIEAIELQYVNQFSNRLKQSFDDILINLRQNQINWKKEKDHSIERHAVQQINVLVNDKLAHTLDRINQVLAQLL